MGLLGQIGIEIPFQKASQLVEDVENQEDVFRSLKGFEAICTWDLTFRSRASTAQSML